MKKLLILCFIFFASIAYANKCIEGNCIDGYGTYKFTKGEFKGDKYVGENENNQMHGLGTYYFADGAKYNIGITAGVETDVVSPEFLAGVNKMNLNIVIII